MNERIKKAYASAPKTWVWQLLAAFIVACLLAWSGTAVRVSSSTGNGLEVAGNILSGIFHPSAKLLLTLGTDGVPYLLLETFCIAFLGTIVGAVISLPCRSCRRAIWCRGAWRWSAACSSPPSAPSPPSSTD